MRADPCRRVLVVASALLPFCLVSLAGPGEAQSLYGFDGAGSLAVEGTGPPAPPCGYPNGPLLSTFPTAVPFACATAASVGPPPGVLGGIAVNKVADTVWVCDGKIATEYTATALPGGVFGLPITSYVIALPAGAAVTGVGFDGTLGVLWLTDGTLAWAEAPPPPPGCGLVGTVVVAPFVLPISGLATGIDWDPVNGTLFVCDATGVVTNVAVGGAIGPFGAWTPLACGLSPLLEGVAVDVIDSIANGMPTLWVTDGFVTEHEVVGGAGAPPSFHAPFTCPPALGPLLGLATAGRAISYGTGADTSGLAAPVIACVGQTLSPNATFQTTLTGSVPGATAGLFLSTSGFLCPPVTVLGLLPVHVNPAGGYIVTTAVVDPFGNAVAATPIPPGFPPGSRVWVQWVATTPMPSVQLSEGLSVVIDLP